MAGLALAIGIGGGQGYSARLVGEESGVSALFSPRVQERKMWRPVLAGVAPQLAEGRGNVPHHLTKTWLISSFGVSIFTRKIIAWRP